MPEGTWPPKNVLAGLDCIKTGKDMGGVPVLMPKQGFPPLRRWTQATASGLSFETPALRNWKLFWRLRTTGWNEYGPQVKVGRTAENGTGTDMRGRK
jgi:hypothetical protein